MANTELKVLIAEDSKMFSTMLSDILRKEGYKITTAIDGAEALDKLHADEISFDLLLLDIQMPNMDGIELLEKIKKDRTPKLPPTLILTATNPDAQILYKLRELGAKGYIVKSQPANEILFRIKSLTTSGENRRRDMKELLSIPIEYSIGKSFISVKSFDFSKSGSYIATTNPSPVGDIIRIRFTIPTEKRKFEVRGKVMYQIKYDAVAKGSYPPGMGVKFMDIPPEDQNAIDKYLSFLQQKKTVMRSDIYSGGLKAIL